MVPREDIENKVHADGSFTAGAARLRGEDDSQLLGKGIALLIGVGTYSRARGLFAGINLNGASIKQDKDETAVLYGKIIPFQTILS